MSCLQAAHIQLERKVVSPQVFRRMSNVLVQHKWNVNTGKNGFCGKENKLISLYNEIIILRFIVLDATGSPNVAVHSQHRAWEIRKMPSTWRETFNGQTHVFYEQGQIVFGVQWHPTGSNIYSKYNSVVHKVQSYQPQSCLLCSWIFLNSSRRHASWSVQSTLRPQMYIEVKWS